MFFSTTAVLLAGLLRTAYGQQIGCSGERIQNFVARDSSAVPNCVGQWNRGDTKFYPDDFEGLENEVEIYQCRTRGVRVIISNAIPGHDVTISNNNGLCEVHWVVELPLSPEVAGTRTEIPQRGMVAMSTNGVPAFGPMESDSLNAVESNGSGAQGAGFWYGHASAGGAWHFHAPEMGEESVTTNTLLGYAMDGFPIYGPLSDNEVSQLDACNGMTDSDGNYRYHVRTLDQVDGTADYCNGSGPENNWNYILGCYSGSVQSTQILSLDNYVLDSDCVLEGLDDPVDPTPAPISPTSAPVSPTQPTRRPRTPRPTRPPRPYLRN